MSRRTVDRMLMTTMLMKALLVLAGSTATLTAAAADGAHCGEIQDAAQRLRCYDAAFGSASEAVSDQRPEPMDAGSPPTDAAPAAPAPSGPQVARIESVVTTSAGREQFRLDNGQTWERADRRAASLRPGDVVQIDQGLFGAHYLREQGGSSRSVKVRPAN